MRAVMISALFSPIISFAYPTISIVYTCVVSFFGLDPPALATFLWVQASLPGDGLLFWSRTARCPIGCNLAFFTYFVPFIISCLCGTYVEVAGIWPEIVCVFDLTKPCKILILL